MKYALDCHFGKQILPEKYNQLSAIQLFYSVFWRSQALQYTVHKKTKYTYFYLQWRAFYAFIFFWLAHFKSPSLICNSHVVNFVFFFVFAQWILRMTCSAQEIYSEWMTYIHNRHFINHFHIVMWFPMAMSIHFQFYWCFFILLQNILIQIFFLSDENWWNKMEINYVLNNVFRFIEWFSIDIILWPLVKLFHIFRILGFNKQRNCHHDK